MIAGTTERTCFSLSRPFSPRDSIGSSFSSRTGATSSMYGLSSFGRISKYSSTSSRSTAGANGRNDSRNLIFTFIVACILRERASPRIERAPSARGPNSMRPAQWPTTFSAAISSATASHSASSSA